MRVVLCCQRWVGLNPLGHRIATSHSLVGVPKCAVVTLGGIAKHIDHGVEDWIRFIYILVLHRHVVWSDNHNRRVWTHCPDGAHLRHKKVHKIRCSLRILGVWYSVGTELQNEQIGTEFRVRSRQKRTVGTCENLAATAAHRYVIHLYAMVILKRNAVEVGTVECLKFKSYVANVVGRLVGIYVQTFRNWHTAFVYYRSADLDGYIYLLGTITIIYIYILELARVGVAHRRLCEAYPSLVWFFGTLPQRIADWREAVECHHRTIFPMCDGRVALAESRTANPTFGSILFHAVLGINGYWRAHSHAVTAKTSLQLVPYVSGYAVAFELTVAVMQNSDFFVFAVMGQLTEEIVKGSTIACRHFERIHSRLYVLDVVVGCVIGYDIVGSRVGLLYIFGHILQSGWRFFGNMLVDIYLARKQRVEINRTLILCRRGQKILE